MGCNPIKHIFIILVSLFIFPIFISPASADVGVDIRVGEPFYEDQETVKYISTVDDCTDVLSIRAVAGEVEKNISVSDTRYVQGSVTAREFEFSGSGAGMFHPEVTITFKDGSPHGDRQSHDEIFQFERVKPSLMFQEINFVKSGGKQYLAVTAQSSDDIDLSYVGFSITGLRASDLRSVGGIVARAKENAFAAIDGYQRVYPSADGQSTFVLPLEVTSALDDASIAHDGVILMDIVSVDSSNNQTSLSKIVFSGEDVVENVMNFSVQPSRILFTNLLQTATIIPTITFQFRGETPLPGRGSGVTYTSSHPNIIEVTDGGVVYPVHETGTTPVFITVSYPGLDPVEIPVTADPTIALTGLKFDGVSDQNPLTLEKLNTWFPLPDLSGVFDDGSELRLSEQFSVIPSLNASATGAIELDTEKGLLAKAVVPIQSPIFLTVRIEKQPDIFVTIPVIANDAIPNVEIDVPDSATVNSQLVVSATAEDDMGVSEVRFLLDGSVVSSDYDAPYEMTLDVPSDYLNRTLHFQAVAVDSAGQTNASGVTEVKVLENEPTDIPDVILDQPVSMQRFIEGSPVRYQIAVPVAGYEGSKISYLEFFLDGEKQGESYYAFFEEREVPAEGIEGQAGKTGTQLFEVWRFDGTLGKISAAETSRAFYAVIHMQNNGKGNTASRLIRIVKNSAPIVEMISPAEGDSVSVGQTLNLDVRFSDDALALGLDATLMINDKEVDQFRYQDDANMYAGSFELKQSSHTFYIPVTEEMLGTTLRFRVKVVDFHGAAGQSTERRLKVRSDQPPSIVIANPVDGAHCVAGLPIDIRVNAVDDVGIANVTFYVDDRLVGSDKTAPYNYSYETVQGISIQQVLWIYAAVVDTMGQRAESSRVAVTLGRDETPPVINIVSPEITHTEGGDDIAEVIEENDIVLKATGYDNVGVQKLELRGVQAQGNGYVLTGNMEDVLSCESFEPQQIPGALHAFSALKLLRVPIFKGGEGVTHDRYPIQVTATDTTGNSSTAGIVVAVGPDIPPVILDVSGDRQQYYAMDMMTLDVYAQDDRAVSGIEMKCFVDGSDQSAVSEQKEIHNKGTAVQEVFRIDLSKLGLSNGAHTIAASFAAIDNKGNRSDYNGPYTYILHVIADETAPLAGISKPVQGVTLYHGDHIQIHWKALDESCLGNIRIEANGTPLFSDQLDQTSETGVVDYVVPDSGEELVLVIDAADVFGNAAQTNWRYPLSSDVPPTISIRSPAQGSRLIEGEPVTLTASVTDNRSVKSATFFIEQGNTSLFSKTFSAAEVASAQESGKYLSVGMRVPHRPGENEPAVTVGVRAEDDSGLVSEAHLDVVLMDDEETPRLTLARPDGPFGVMPGVFFKVKGQGDDNKYIDNLEPVLIDGQGKETVLSWTGFSRENRVETVKVANPDSLGALVVGSRFYVNFEGRIKLPLSYFDHVGETYTFLVRGRDYGYNEAVTPGVDLTVNGDETPPVIRIIRPGDTVYERQQLKAHISIYDDIALESYSVRIEDWEKRPIVNKTGLETATIERNDIDIDLSIYDPADPEKNHFSLIVDAADQFGNTSQKAVLVTVDPDQAPNLSVVDEQPSDDLLKGGIAFQTIKIKDDYVAPENGASLSYFPVYTSLKGLGALGCRGPTGMTADEVNGTVTPYISFNYSEAGGLAGKLTIDDRIYLEITADNQLYIRPVPELDQGQTSFLKLDFGPDYVVKYNVLTILNDPCTSPPEEVVVASSTGVDLLSLSEDFSDINAIGCSSFPITLKV